MKLSLTVLSQTVKTLHFFTKCALLIQDCYKKGITTDSSMIQENSKIIAWNLKQEEDEECEAGRI